MKSINFQFVCLMGLLAFTLSSCGSAKMAQYMDQHKATLAKALVNGVSGEDKLDIVAGSLVTALNESLSYSSTKKSVQHINKFSKSNEKALNTIIKDLDGWMQGMSPAEKIMTFGKIAKKPYAKELMTLIPQVEKKVNRKMQTFKIASKLLGVLKPKLF